MGRCNVVMGKAKMESEMMQKLLVGHLARLCESLVVRKIHNAVS